MFTRWGDLVYRLRWAVIGIVCAALLALGGYGFGLEDHLSSSGWDDPTSESAAAARISDSAFGRDHTSDVIVLYTAPEGKTIDDPQFREKIVDSLNRLPKEHPEEIAKVNGAYWQTDTGPGVPLTFGSKDKKYTFASIAIVGDNDTDMVRNFRKVKDVFYIEGVDVQVTGLQAVAGTLNDTMAADQKRMEILAIPAVAVLLFFIFGGLVAAGLPLVVGGLTVIGANGIIMFLTKFTEVNSFVGGVVSMIGLGLAIDYGLFIVSRFREELAEGYDTRAAVRRSVMTAGRTVVFSATMIIASLGGMLLFPQGFLKSVAYGTIATVSLAALTAITILPAMLGVLGPRVDMLGLKRFRKTKTAEEVENGFWGKTTQWVMKHPLKIAVPICIGLLLLIIPVKNLAFGGINERYLPPDNKTRVALENFYEVFPLKKTDPVQLVMVSDDSAAVGKVWKEAGEAPGLTGKFEVPSRSTSDPNVYRTSATLEDSENYDPTIEYLRSMDVPDNVQLYVGGQPSIQKDSIDALLDRMPLMIALVIFVTTLLMFLTFGSLVLPIKAALMSALGLGSTLGILTWIFVDGHGASLLNFTPQPIMSPVLVLIIAVIYGLSTDYEVFLISRMVEARTQGASTTEAVRAGTAHTGRIITAAALILLVVVGAFAFSDLVMMQYIAYGLIAALFIDATILRMLLVPATMKLLGDDCWWAPAWMKRIQEKIGLGEPILDDERPGGGEVVDLVKTTPITDPVTMQMPAVAEGKQPRTPRRVRTIEEIEAEAPTQSIDSVPVAKGSVAPRAPRSTSAGAHGFAPGASTPGVQSATPRRGASGAHSAESATPGSTTAGAQSESPATPGAETPGAQSRSAAAPRSATPGAPSSSTAMPGASTPGAQSVPPRPRTFGAYSAESATPGSTTAGAQSGSTGAGTSGAPSGSAAAPRSGTPGSQSGSTAMPGATSPGAQSVPPRPRTFGAYSTDSATPGSAAPGAQSGSPATPGTETPGAQSGSAAPSSGAPGPHDPTRPRASSLSGLPDPNPGRSTPTEPPRPRAVPFAADRSGSIDDATRPIASEGAPARSHSSGADAGQHGASAYDPTIGGGHHSSTQSNHTSSGTTGYDQSAHHAAPDNGAPETPDDNRTSIENWMAELRSSRRRIADSDEGRHHSGDGRSVSVNELLRRHDED
ncbi:putative drug exporter of the RND superfamily [Nocardia amikacinitolerans]|uniref:MMPL family transporter n=1 Tax=Nocardia amikacinitolerans TaxID=756689 RepID=UPI00082B59A4|nr:MMPL family transporter [Nocardia amikacinitolerans]MCP2319397.1 putative drug exporter of the RND superfamily [Nocardia amikacinitolerans]